MSRQRLPFEDRRPMKAKQARLRFYAELTDFLSPESRSGTVTVGFDVPGSVKDLIEACGVPHTEVDLILANGDSVDFSYPVGDGDRISVYPVFESFDITSLLKVRPRPLRAIRFLADNHLARLARYLRLLGFDTAHDPLRTDHELVQISTGEQRVLLTRDVGLLKHGSVTHGYYVRATDPRRQITEVGHRFHLAGQLHPFTRCMTCNGKLVAVRKEEVADQLPPHTREQVEEYRCCDSCHQIYWNGSHHQALSRIVDSVASG